jgi:hypothetical protein
VGEALPYALGVAVSPVAIAAILLLLTSRRAAANGTLFAVGWASGVAVVAGAFAVLVQRAAISDTHPVWVSVLELALGAAFLAAAAVLIRRRRRRQARSTSVIAAADTLTPLHAAGLGIVLSGANPKVLALALGAALALAQAEAGARTTAESVVLFTAIGTVGVIVPLATYLVLPLRSQRVLARARTSLVRHETAVLILLGLAIGAVFLSDGLRSLG